MTMPWHSLINFPNAAQLCFSLQVLCNNSEFHQSWGLVVGVWWILALLLIGAVLGCAAHSSICLHILWGTSEPVLSAQEELACHSATPAAMSPCNKRWKLSLGETAGRSSRSELELSKLLLSDHWHSRTAIQKKAAMQWCVKFPQTKLSICLSTT